MSSDQEIRPLPTALGPIRAAVTLPGSKSLTNRALLVAAMAEGESVLTGALFSDDTHYMSEALRMAGVEIEADAARREFRVRGTGDPPAPVEDRLFLGNAGTAMRFLTAYFTLGHGTYALDGAPRMRQRPIQDLVDSLQNLGASLACENDDGCPPVVISAHGLEGGHTSIPGSRSSQYSSAILMAGARSRQGVDLEIEGHLASRPYLDLTTDVMAAFGVEVENQEYRRFRVPPGRYTGRPYAVEPDASAASYFLGAAAVTDGRVTVRGLSTRSRQGDIEFVRILERMGCTVRDTEEGLALEGAPSLSGVDVDMNECSDVALTLAVVAPFCTSPTHIRNVAHMRIQETDRIHAIVTELQRAGIRAEEREDGFSIYPGAPHPATFETYEDHRIAMSLSLIGLRTPGCAVINPDCVNKTFPGFFGVLENVLKRAGDGPDVRSEAKA